MDTPSGEATLPFFLFPPLLKKQIPSFKGISLYGRISVSMEANRSQKDASTGKRSKKHGGTHTLETLPV